MKGPLSQQADSGELPLAPFLDIIFILLIFVLVSTQMVSDRVLPVDLARSGSGQEIQAEQSRIQVYLEGGRVRIPVLQISTTVENLAPLLQDHCTGEPILMIRAAASTSLQSFVSLSDALHGCGIVQLVVEEGVPR